MRQFFLRDGGTQLWRMELFIAALNTPQLLVGVFYLLQIYSVKVVAF